MDPDGHLYVSDGRFDVIQVFDEEGQLLLIVGGHGFGRGRALEPGRDRLSIPTGSLAVADTGNRRVQLLRYQRRSPR